MLELNLQLQGVPKKGAFKKNDGFPELELKEKAG